MNDYKELIEMLRSMSRAIIREDANDMDISEDNIWDADANALVDAADAIESLTKEYKELDELNDAVCKEYRKVKKERDAAVNDFKKFAIYAGLKKTPFACDWCKSQMSDGKCKWFIDHKDDKTCRGVHFEWCGVREDDDENTQ